MLRQKKPFMVLTFPSTDCAMAMEQFCIANQIPGRHIPVPSQISAGCGIAWRMTIEAFQEYEEILNQSGIDIENHTEVLMY